MRVEIEDGIAPFNEWFDAFETPVALKVTAAVARMETDVKPVGQGVSEQRLPFGPGYQIYSGQDGRKIVVLLTGGTKRRQSRDIEQAHAYWVG